MSEYKEVILDEEIKAVFNGSINQSKNGESWIPEVNKVKRSIDGDETQFLYDAGESPHIIKCYEIVMAQDEEKICIKVFKDMLAEKVGLRKADRQQLPHETCVLLPDYQNLSVDDKGLLYRKISPKKQKQLVLPLKFKPLASSKLHVKIGHLGIGRSMQLIKDRFYWPGVSFDISHLVTKVSVLRKKTPTKVEKALLQCISSNAPMELSDLDFLHLDPCRKGCEYLLVITDNVLGFTQAYPTVNKKAKQ